MTSSITTSYIMYWHHDENSVALTSSLASSELQDTRTLESEGGLESSQPSDATASNSTSPPDKFHQLTNQIDPLWMIVWACATLLAFYLLYLVCKCWLRRRRTQQSEYAMTVLGDLQMLPTGDFSDSHGEEEESDSII
jgi:hypothetical protein